MNLTELLVKSYDSERKIWSGPTELQHFNANCSIGQIALYMMRCKPANTVCQISDSERTTLTYDVASTYAIRIAQHFQRIGLTQDDVVGLVAPNTTLVMPVAVACWLNCTPFHVLNPIFEESVISHLFSVSKPKVIFCDGTFYQKIKNATAALKPKFFTLCNHIDELPKVEDLLQATATEMLYQPASLSYGENQVMGIYCTSGTTGMPKCVSLSNARMFSLLFEIVNGAAVIFSFALPDWLTGLVGMLHTVLVGGTRIITTQPYDPAYMLQIITKYKVTFIASPANHVTQMTLLPDYNKTAMQSLRMMFITGVHTAPATLERIRAQLTRGKLLNSYGSMEIGAIAGHLTNYKPNTVGKVLPNVQLRIIDEHNRQPLGYNEVGEICAKRACKCLGYYNNADANKSLIEADDFVSTGDLGYMDEENYLHLVDRSKDMMRYNNLKFSPHEIEEAIAELPDVLDVCLFSVYDEFYGDLAAAAIVKRDHSKLSEAEVLNYVQKKKQVKYKQLNYGVFFVKEIIRNSNGKALRHKMKELCLGMSAVN